MLRQYPPSFVSVPRSGVNVDDGGKLNTFDA